jgi:hypothetical protein
LDYINSLISGIVIFKIGREYIYVKPASAEDKTFADFFSQEQYDDALIDGIWTQEDAENHLISMGYWLKEDDETIKEIEKNVENMKADYFNHFYNSTTRDYIKKNINKQNERYQGIYNKKYTFYDKTCEYLKRYSFVSHILQKNSFLQNGELASTYYPTQILYNKYASHTNDLGSNIREITKSNEWRNKWFSLKNDIFENKLSSLTDFQLSIISWSNYYDGIYQSMDKPPDEIIEDDIAMDGWSIIQKRKRQEEEKKKNAEKMLPEKMQKAGEVFIPARNSKEASDVMSLNDAYGVSKIKSLKKDLKENGAVNESDLTSTRQELQMQSIQMARENRRR